MLTKLVTTDDHKNIEDNIVNLVLEAVEKTTGFTKEQLNCKSSRKIEYRNARHIYYSLCSKLGISCYKSTMTIGTLACNAKFYNYPVSIIRQMKITELYNKTVKTFINLQKQNQ